MNNQPRNGLIAKIKIAQKELKMDDDTYRIVLQRVVGKISCTQMTMLELERVCAEMQRLGFAPLRPAPEKIPLHFAEHSAQFKKIHVLLKKNGKTWAYANGIAKKMFGKSKVNQCNGNEIRSIIAALNYHIKKQEQT